jgi:predicted transcriptional regulator
MNGNKEIVIRSIEKPSRGKENADTLIRWFCVAFGLSKSDEKESLEEKILKKFIYAAFKNEGLSSSEISFGKPIPRSTIIYHLNRFVELGIIVKRGRKYYLRAMDMASTIKELEYDMNREMMKMFDIAEELNNMVLKSLGAQKALKGKKQGRS